MGHEDPIPWLTLAFVTVNYNCRAQLSAPPNGSTKQVNEIRKVSEQIEARPAQTQKLVGELNFAPTAIMRRVGRVARRPLSDLVMRGGGRIDKGARWILEWLLRLPPVMAPRIIRPIGRAVVVRSYTYPGTTGGGIAAVASSSRQQVEFTVLLNGVAGRFLLESSGDINDIFGL